MYEVHSLNDAFITFIEEKDIGNKGSAAGSSPVFTATDAKFQTNGVALGDTLTVNGQGQYQVLTVDSETQLTLATNLPAVSNNQYSVGNLIDLSENSCQRQYFLFVRNAVINPQAQFERIPQLRYVKRRRRLVDFFVSVELSGLVYDLAVFNKIASYTKSYTMRLYFKLPSVSVESGVYVLGCENITQQIQNTDNQDSLQQLNYQGIYHSYVTN